MKLVACSPILAALSLALVGPVCQLFSADQASIWYPGSGYPGSDLRGGGSGNNGLKSPELRAASNVASQEGNYFVIPSGRSLYVIPTGSSPTTPAVADDGFGFHPAQVAAAGYADSGFVDAQNIGVNWHRPTIYAYWFIVQPDLTTQTYDWSVLDNQFGVVPQGINIMANIAPDNPLVSHGYTQTNSYIPVNEGQYSAFVRAVVERYDGDATADMNGLSNPIKHWQVDNEPTSSLSGFADLQRLTYLAVKEACPDCTVIIGGVAGFPSNYLTRFDAVYLPILAQLAGNYIDIFDFHWYGTATGEYRLQDSATGEDVYDHVRSALSANGFPAELPMWITEMGSYSGDPSETQFPAQSERQQASDYFKRFIYPLARGVKKIFPAFGLIEGFRLNDGYFDHTGLIYDGRGSNDLGLGIKKLGYYTYKKMTEKLGGADWTTLTMLHDGRGTDNLYLFRVTKAGQPVHIAWWDYFQESGYTAGDHKELSVTGLTGSAVNVTTVTPAAETGQQVTDYATAFSVTPYQVSAGAITLSLGEDPVILE